ncbi:MAG: GTPase Era [Magnetococcus sp. WYHC-3]
MEAGLRSGFVAIVGRPNMGKSTFLNRVLGRKVAIVTPKAQTTRTRILGACHRPGVQIVFLDTPGIHEVKGSPLNRTMVRTAREACRQVDLVLYFVSAPQGLLAEDLEIIRALPRGDAPVILVINKVDRMPERPQLLPVLARAGALARELEGGIAEMVPISAQDGDNVEHLLEFLSARLPPGPAYFPEEMVTDQAEGFIAAEFVREQLFLRLRQELPYDLGVGLEHSEERDGRLHFHLVVLVNRHSQKGIVIGKGGSLLKDVGSHARAQLEHLFGVPVVLKIWVKVTEGWHGDMRRLRELGYEQDLDGAD